MVLPKRLGDGVRWKFRKAFLFFFARSRVTQQTGKLFAKGQHVFLRNESCVVAPSCIRVPFFSAFLPLLSVFRTMKSCKMYNLSHYNTVKGMFLLAVLKFQRALHKPVKLQTCLLLAAWIFASITDSLDHGEGVKRIKICSVHFLKCAPSHTPV